MKSEHDSFWQEGLQLLSNCPLCEAAYEGTDLQVLQKNKEHRLFHVVCSDCENALLALIFVHRGGVGSVGLVTDLSFEDAQRFMQRSHITADHVLLAHEQLRSTNDLSKLLRSID